MAKREGGVAPRYEEIAVDLARKIVEREIREGDRILGRSTLAGQYKVSPETIRRAMAILHERGVVQSVPGSGIRIVSRRMAAEFLEGLQTRTAIEALQSELVALTAERRELDRRIAEVTNRLAQLANRALETSRRLEEVPVPPGSWLEQESLTSARLRNLTGATVIGIVRDHEEFYSPPPTFELKAGDLLMVVGSTEARERTIQVVGLFQRPPEGLEYGK